MLMMGAEAYNETIPEWVELECEVCNKLYPKSYFFVSLFQNDHKYLFSDVQHNWNEARAECVLYGGWLVQINNMKEYNCLLRHGMGFDTPDTSDSRWYWIDVNDVANTGVLTHAYDDSEVSFFPPRVMCGCSKHTTSTCSNGADAYVLKLNADRHERGTYCDHMSNENWKFICEANI